MANEILENYVVLDLENPNSRGNSICSIGIIIVKDNCIVDEIYSLINPEDRFDEVNQKITGINSVSIIDSPKINEYWFKIKDLLTKNIVVGHNVIYDLNVLSKSLDRYEIEVPVFNYCCTLDLSRRYLNCDSYKLSSLAEIINHKYIQHNALDDAMASHKLMEYLKNNIKIKDFNVRKFEYEMNDSGNLGLGLESTVNELYGIINGINYDQYINNEEIARLRKWVEDNRINKCYSLIRDIINYLEKILEDNILTKYEYIELFNAVESINNSKVYNRNTLSLQVLKGIINGIVCDNIINIEEIELLSDWLKNNDYLTDVYPYDKVLLIVNKVLEDGVLLNEENELLLKTFNEVINPTTDSCLLELDGKTYCLTGEFKFGTKDDIRKKINPMGCIEKSDVSSKLDYLFVGSMGSENWKFGNIGGKILRAQELQEQGSKIKIISEDDLIKQI